MDFNDLKVILLNQFMILSKQLQVVLTHFLWKILIFGVAERQTRDYYRFEGFLTHQKTFGALILVILYCF